MPTEIPEIQTDTVTSFLDRVRSLEVPSTEDVVELLRDLGPLQAILLLACGLVYMLQGWKIFKALVVINAAVLGIIIGASLGGLLKGQNMPLFGAIAGGLLLAALAWPLMKFAVSLMGGLAGSFLGYGVWNYIANATGRDALIEYAWAGALIGLITLGLLAFVIFRLVVMIFTSLQGSTMTIGGLAALLMKNESFRGDISAWLTDNSHLLPLAILVPAVIGFAFQRVAVAKKAKKRRKASEGDG